MSRTGTEVHTRERIQKIGRRLHFPFEEVGRIPADLLQGLWVDLSEVHPVTRANNASVRSAPGNSKLRTEGIAIAIKVDGTEFILLIGSGNGGVSKAVINR